jgi:rhodanese-related sulfurtransferase
VKTVNAKEISKRRGEVFYRIGKRSLIELYQEYEDDHHESFSGSALSPSSDGGPRIITYEEQETPKYEKPYLILDVRDALDYNKGHLLQSRSYPYTMMRRDYTHPELFNFKNKDERLIIMYCDDERISEEAAFLLVQRGCDNVYLLTGGLFEFASTYRSYVEGEVTLPKGSPSKARAKSSTSSGTLMQSYVVRI